MFLSVGVLFFFFFKQKTAYEMRISDWSPDVCSSDLPADGAGRRGTPHRIGDQPFQASPLAVAAGRIVARIPQRPLHRLDDMVPARQEGAPRRSGREPYPEPGAQARPAEPGRITA